MKNRSISERAWNRLRLALLWARKGGMLRRRLWMELRVVSKYLKRLGHTSPPTEYPYYERELSFDETPIFSVKMNPPSSICFHLPHIPCINPQVDFEDEHHIECDHTRSHASLMSAGHKDEEYHYDYQDQEEEEIDKRAENFIAKFYQQMKLQRQISYLQYYETYDRCSN